MSIPGHRPAPVLPVSRQDLTGPAVERWQHAPHSHLRGSRARLTATSIGTPVPLPAPPSADILELEPGDGPFSEADSCSSGTVVAPHTALGRGSLPSRPRRSCLPS